MYSKELIETYMSVKKYTQQKQMAADMEISPSYLSDIYRGKRHFTEESALYIAIECELDPKEVIMKLAEERAKTPQAKNVWASVLKEYCTGAEAAACAGFGLFAALLWTPLNFALWLVTLKQKKNNDLPIKSLFIGVYNEKRTNDG